MEFKKDPFLLGLAAVCVIALTVLTARSVITWPEMVVGITLLGLPSVFGTRKEPPP